MKAKNDQFERNDRSLHFDFDEWASLYRTDPEAFEKRRLEWCSLTIKQAPEAYHRRLSGLMFQINMEKRRSPNPMKSCLRLSRMMWDKFHELKDELQELTVTRASVDTTLISADGESDLPSSGAKGTNVVQFTHFHPLKEALVKSGNS